MNTIESLLKDGRVDKDATKEIYHLDVTKVPDIVAKIKSSDILLGDGHIYVLIAGDGSKEVVIGNSSDTYDSAFKVSASSDEPTTVNWDDIEDKPSTFDPTIGTTSTTAKAGDWAPAVADVPNLPTSKITSGTFADARIPSLSTSKITSGTFAIAQTNSVLSGLGAGTNEAVTATDTLLQAIAKLQAQITALVTP